MAVSSDVSIVIPLTDARGDAVEHLRTWTHAQTHPRDRYQVVIASDGADPQVDRDVQAILAPHDEFQVTQGAGLVRLYNAAARSAAAPWLLVTENHCRGKPDCVEEAVRGIEASPDLAAATIEHGHVTPGVTGELGARWFADVYAEWETPDGWTRLNLAGFLIRRHVFESVGGLDERYGLFAPPLVAATLDQRGARIGHVPAAGILHFHVDGIDEHHGHSANFAAGELAARPSLDPVFAERYFGHHHLIWNRAALSPEIARPTLSILAGELRRSALTDRRDLRWLAGEAGSRLPEAAAGSRPRRWLARLRFRWNELAARLPWSKERRYSHYLRAQDRVVRLTQLEWIAAHPDGEDPHLAPGDHPIEEIGEGVAIGVHGLEQHDGRSFRWSEPVLRLRLDPAARGGQLRIDTGGLRESPRTAVIGTYLGEKRLRPSGLSEQGHILVVPIPHLPGDLTLVIRPLEAPAGSPPDARALGLPIFGVELEGAGSSTGASENRESVPVN